MKLIYHDQLNWVRSVVKTKQDNEMTELIGLVYIENDTKALWLIRLGQWHN